MLYLTDLEMNVFENILKTSKEEDNGKFIEIGTAGARGINGPGINHINSYTILKYIKGCLEFYKENKVILIGYDGRYLSKYYATFIFNYLIKYTDTQPILADDTIPTPIFSYECNYRKNVKFGVMITASHNPQEYNGIKIFNPNGSQPNENDSEEIYKAAKYSNIIQEEVFVENSIYSYKFDTNFIFDEYLKNYESYYLTSDLSVAYSPLHGVGEKYILKQIFSLFENINTITLDEEGYQSQLFNSNVNPETSKAFSRILSKINNSKNKPDLIFATDPDCDRIGLMVKHNNKYEFLNGQELITILAYNIKKYKQKGNINLSYVTTSFIDDILNDYEIKRTPVGFRFLAELINNNTILSAEESCSYNTRNFILDKDPFSFLYDIMIIADKFKRKNKTLVDLLNDIYIENMKYFQYKQIKTNKNLINKVENALKTFDNDNTIKYYLRPSGTEDSLKIYLEVFSKKNSEDAKRKLNIVEQSILDFL